MSDLQNKYKFKSLKLYSSDEWMVDETKRYRTVFEKSELKHLRVELALNNKEFDKSDWACKVELKAFKIENAEKKELCNLDVGVYADKKDAVIFVRDGWGTYSAGEYWTEGEYYWEANVDGIIVGSATFFVNNIGLVSLGKNPYFEIEGIRFYCGNFEGWRLEKRKYLSCIQGKATEYLWCELKIKTLTRKEWNYELFFNFFDHSGQFKAQTLRAGKVERDKLNWSYSFDVGWGNATAGSWKPGEYTLTLVFMDVIVAMASFDCGDKEIEGVPDFISLP
ncbi:MAG: hypothetical protein IAF38_09160, partial [Bacteroidia bacterium]|nr:hypothetical protein [Bacteroidia bacterium]